MSEFGDGYAYCLGLFLAHAERVREYKQREEDMQKRGHPHGDYPEMWFNGAADHLFGLQIPQSLPADKQAEIVAFRDRCVAFRLSMGMPPVTWEDVSAALNYAKRLLLEWDLFHSIPAEKGDWE